MADNVILNSGSGGETCATDDVSGVQYQVIKLADGTADSATRIVAGGGVEANALRVTIASDSTGLLSVDDNGGSLTVDAPVGTPVFVRLSDGSAAITTLPVSLASVPSHAVTNAGTFAVQAAQSGAYTVDLGATDNAVLDAIAASLASTLTIAGAVTNAGTFAVQVSSALPTGTNSIGQVTANAGTNLNTSALALESGGNLASILTSVQLLDDSVYIDDADWTALTSKHTLIGGVYTSAARTITDGDTAPFSIDVNGHTIVSPHGASTALADNVSNTINLIVDQSNGFTAMATVGYMFDGSTWDRIRGTSADGLLVNLGTNNDVTITSGTVTTVTTLSTLTGGGIAHDAADSGNPVKIGVKATASVLGGTPVAAADRTDLYAGTDGVLIVRQNCSLEDIISEQKTNTDGASTAMTGAFAATASQRIYLTGISIANSSASNITVDIRDGAAGSVLWTFPVPTVGGVVYSFNPPLRFTANTALAFDGSAAATTLTVSCIGFKSKA